MKSSRGGAKAVAARGCVALVVLLGLVAALALGSPSPLEAQEAIEWRLAATLYGEDSGRFAQPQGLFFNKDTKMLLVGSTGDDRFVMYGEQDGVLVVKKHFAQPHIVTAPRHFVQNSKGNIVVSQEATRKLQVVSPEGGQVSSIDLNEMPGGDTFVPGDIKIRLDRLYVVDETGGRIVVLDEDGRYVREMRPDDPTFHKFNAVAVDGGGFVFGLDTIGGKVYQFSPEGALQSTFGQRGLEADQFAFPTAITVDDRGLIYVVDQHRGTVLLFNRQGRFVTHFVSKGWEEGEAYYPCDIAVDGAGRVFIADRNNNRVEVFARVEK